MKKKAKLTDFKKQRKNANKHTQRGLELLDKSITKNGWIGAMTAAADGEIFDGSARLETVESVLPADPIVVETDGKRPIIIKRTDIKKASDPKAVRLALEANRIAQVDLNWDVDVLKDIAKKKMELLDDIFSAADLSAFGISAPQENEDGGVSGGINVQNQYGVIVICADEAEQEATYNALLGEGYKVKVVVV